jgi:large subunit ribosomal protein L9
LRDRRGARCSLQPRDDFDPPLTLSPRPFKPRSLLSSLSQKATALKAVAAPRVAGRSARLNVQANKRVAKKANVVLTQSVPDVGAAGDLVEVSLGYFRNHLEPMGKAKKATAEILAEVEADAAKNAESAGAKAMATALKTIGKFVVKKTVGEDGKIFGSVTAADVAAAVEMQTGKTLDKKDIDVPDISEVGTYDVTVKLHPEVTGEFKVEVQKA